MRNNHNNFPFPNHVNQATFLALCIRANNINGLRPIPTVNNNLDIPNPNTSVVNNPNTSVVNNDLNVLTTDTSVVILDNSSDVHPALLGVEQSPTE
ncbi:hypothetical protein [Candidatus Tisiphia endosymbiont of Oplodontha viridula]|uniref:hypothetical protein n=1 Tax=Candidatus Tisiphia endosymbiont of Oplodontha viridula TaxID=3077925 RepID=UPI0035C8C62A